MDFLLNLISIASIIAAAYFGVVGISKKTKDDNGNLNKWGRVALFGVLISNGFSLSKEGIKQYQDSISKEKQRKAQEETIKKQDSILKAVDTTLLSVNKTLLSTEILKQQSKHIDTNIQDNLKLLNYNTSRQSNILGDLNRASRLIFPIDNVKVTITIPITDIPELEKPLIEIIKKLTENKNPLTSSIEGVAFVPTSNRSKISFNYKSEFLQDFMQRNTFREAFFDYNFGLVISKSPKVLSGEKYISISSFFKFLKPKTDCCVLEATSTPNENLEIFYDRKRKTLISNYFLILKSIENNSGNVISVLDLKNKWAVATSLPTSKTNKLDEVCLYCGTQKETICLKGFEVLDEKKSYNFFHRIKSSELK